MRATASAAYTMSLATMMQSDGRNSVRGIFSSVMAESSGTISTDSLRSLDSWSCTSKVRMVSISSPKKSIRYGSSELKEYTSSMLPRTANCPGSYT